MCLLFYGKNHKDFLANPTITLTLQKSVLYTISLVVYSTSLPTTTYAKFEGMMWGVKVNMFILAFQVFT